MPVRVSNLRYWLSSMSNLWYDIGQREKQEQKLEQKLRQEIKTERCLDRSVQI